MISPMQQHFAKVLQVGPLLQECAKILQSCSKIPNTSEAPPISSDPLWALFKLISNLQNKVGP